MPASTLDPVSAALRNALTKSSSEEFLSSQLSGSSRRVLSTNIEFESTDSYQSTVLNNLKSKYIVLQGNKQTAPSRKQEMGADETISTPQRVLYPLEAVQLGWNNTEWSVGTGMVNMGNTCYLNSTLQALFHVPALVNWLLSDRQQHTDKCEDSGGGNGGCIICAMTKTLQASQQRNTNAIRPWLIFSKLRIVCRHLVPGRQEDAHEFLRYLVEAMERAYIQRFRNLAAPLDTRSKETTPLNQILGGYLRSTVRCLECGHVSTTFQHFQDLLLDIRKVNTLDDALDLYFSREKLDDMAYHCENCQKKVLATKQFSLERAPMVLCIQLKRFSVTNNKITKHITFRQRLELTQFARRKSSPPLVYRLVSLVTHVGQTVGCGHYTAVAQAPTGNFYQFDDSMVRPISQQAVFNTNAYIMLYELECSHTTSSPKSAIVCKNYNNKSVQNSDSLAHLVKESSTSSPLNNASSSHLNGLSAPAAAFSQNGNGRCVNGADKHNSDSSSDSDETERVSSVVPQNATQRTNKTSSYSATCSPKSTTMNSPNLSLSLNSSSLNSAKTVSKETDSVLPVNSNSCNNNQQQKSQQSTMKKHCNNTSNGNSNGGSGDGGSERKPYKQFQENVSSSSTGNTQPMTKLVPYEVDDSSCSAEESSTITAAAGTAEPSSKLHIVTKAGAWQVSPTKNTFHKPSLEGQAGWNRQQQQQHREAVTELMHMSHEGYSAPVATWNGTRAALDREINNERREDRKRGMVDSPDKGRVKQAKHNSNNSYIGNKSNPGYNPFQEYSNARKWQNDSHFYGKSSHYNNNMRHRYNHRRGNYHNNHRHRDKFKH